MKSYLRKTVFGSKGEHRRTPVWNTFSNSFRTSNESSKHKDDAHVNLQGKSVDIYKENSTQKAELDVYDVDNDFDYDSESSDQNSESDEVDISSASLRRSEFACIMADIGDEIPSDMYELWDRTIEFTDSLSEDEEKILNIGDYVKKQKEHDDILQGFKSYFNDFAKAYVIELWENEKLDYLKRNISEAKSDQSEIIDPNALISVESKISLLKGTLESIYRLCQLNETIYAFLINENSEIKDMHDYIDLDNKYKNFSDALNSFLPIGEKHNAQDWGNFFSDLWDVKRLSFISSVISSDVTKDKLTLFENILPVVYKICESNRHIYDFLESKDYNISDIHSCIILDDRYQNFSMKLKAFVSSLENVEEKKFADSFNSYFLNLWVRKRLDFVNTSSSIVVGSDGIISVEMPQSEDELDLLEKVFSDLYEICRLNKGVYDFLEDKEYIVKNVNECMRMDEGYRDFSYELQTLQENLHSGGQDRKCVEFFMTYFFKLWCEKRLDFINSVVVSNSSRAPYEVGAIINLDGSVAEFENVLDQLYEICRLNNELYNFLEKHSKKIKNVHSFMLLDSQYKSFSALLEEMNQSSELGSNSRRYSEIFMNYFLQLWTEKRVAFINEFIKSKDDADINLSQVQVNLDLFEIALAGIKDICSEEEEFYDFIENKDNSIENVCGFISRSNQSKSFNSKLERLINKPELCSLGRVYVNHFRSYFSSLWAEKKLSFIGHIWSYSLDLIKDDSYAMMCLDDMRNNLSLFERVLDEIYLICSENNIYESLEDKDLLIKNIHACMDLNEKYKTLSRKLEEFSREDDIERKCRDVFKVYFADLWLKKRLKFVAQVVGRKDNRINADSPEIIELDSFIKAPEIFEELLDKIYSLCNSYEEFYYFLEEGSIYDINNFIERDEQYKSFQAKVKDILSGLELDSTAMVCIKLFASYFRCLWAEKRLSFVRISLSSDESRDEFKFLCYKGCENLAAVAKRHKKLRSLFPSEKLGWLYKGVTSNYKESYDNISALCSYEWIREALQFSTPIYKGAGMPYEERGNIALRRAIDMGYVINGEEEKLILFSKNSGLQKLTKYELEDAMRSYAKVAYINLSKASEKMPQQGDTEYWIKKADLYNMMAISLYIHGSYIQAKIAILTAGGVFKNKCQQNSANCITELPDQINTVSSNIESWKKKIDSVIANPPSYQPSRNESSSTTENSRDDATKQEQDDSQSESNAADNMNASSASGLSSNGRGFKRCAKEDLATLSNTLVAIAKPSDILFSEVVCPESTIDIYREEYKVKMSSYKRWEVPVKAVGVLVGVPSGVAATAGAAAVVTGSASAVGGAAGAAVTYSGAAAAIGSTSGWASISSGAAALSTYIGSTSVGASVSSAVSGAVASLSATSVGTVLTTAALSSPVALFGLTIGAAYGVAYCSKNYNVASKIVNYCWNKSEEGTRRLVGGNDKPSAVHEEVIKINKKISQALESYNKGNFSEFLIFLSGIPGIYVSKKDDDLYSVSFYIETFVSHLLNHDFRPDSVAYLLYLLADALIIVKKDFSNTLESEVSKLILKTLNFIYKKDKNKLLEKAYEIDNRMRLFDSTYHKKYIDGVIDKTITVKLYELQQLALMKLIEINNDSGELIGYADHFQEIQENIWFIDSLNSKTSLLRIMLKELKDLDWAVNHSAADNSTESKAADNSDYKSAEAAIRENLCKDKIKEEWNNALQKISSDSSKRKLDILRCNLGAYNTEKAAEDIDLYLKDYVGSADYWYLRAGHNILVKSSDEAMYANTQALSLLEFNASYDMLNKFREQRRYIEIFWRGQDSDRECVNFMGIIKESKFATELLVGRQLDDLVEEVENYDPLTFISKMNGRWNDVEFQKTNLIDDYSILKKPLDEICEKTIKYIQKYIRYQNRLVKYMKESLLSRSFVFDNSLSFDLWNDLYNKKLDIEDSICQYIDNACVIKDITSDQKIKMKKISSIKVKAVYILYIFKNIGLHDIATGLMSHLSLYNEIEEKIEVFLREPIVQSQYLKAFFKNGDFNILKLCARSINRRLYIWRIIDGNKLKIEDYDLESTRIEDDIHVGIDADNNLHSFFPKEDKDRAENNLRSNMP